MKAMKSLLVAAVAAAGMMAAGAQAAGHGAGGFHGGGGHGGGGHWSGGGGHWHGGGHVHSSFGVVVGFPWYGWGWGWGYPYYGYPYYGYPYDYYYPAAYPAYPASYPAYPQGVMQAPETTEVPRTEGAPTQAPAYMNYCESAKAYFPKVTSCPEGWKFVPTR